MQKTSLSCWRSDHSFLCECTCLMAESMTFVIRKWQSSPPPSSQSGCRAPTIRPLPSESRIVRRRTLSKWNHWRAKSKHRPSCSLWPGSRPMKANDLSNLLMASPFEPLIVRLNNGRSYEIRRPGMAIVTSSVLAIGVSRGYGSRLAERIVRFSLSDIVLVEPAAAS